MPGAYAHITVVNMLREPQRLEAISDFSFEAIPAILDYFKFCELGAVSPDYPYLAVGDSKAAEWADTMHYVRTGQMIHSGINHVQAMSGEKQAKCLAWLLGFTAHVVTDVTIHPVVELKVGSYHGNETEHRICEMNQDAHIFQRLNLGGIGISEHLDSGLCACSNNNDGLDTDISELWANMFKDVHLDQLTTNPPDYDRWHSRFKLVVDNVAEEGNKLMPLARHIAVGLGLVYPNSDEIDTQYITDLNTPNGAMNYDDIFDKAVDNVGVIWAVVGQGVFGSNTDYMSVVKDWNLDTGRDADGELSLWV